MNMTQALKKSSQTRLLKHNTEAMHHWDTISTNRRAELQAETDGRQGFASDAKQSIKYWTEGLGREQALDWDAVY